MKDRIAILGAGRLGEALVRGFLESGWRQPGDLTLTARREDRRLELAERYGTDVQLDNARAAASAALVIVAVKPQDAAPVVEEIAPVLGPGHTLLTVAAALPTGWFEERLPDGVPVIRAMPNTPATVGEGIAAVCAGAHADEAHLQLAEEALRHLGAVVRVEEQYMDVVTAVSGSGPAYFSLLVESMIEAGVLLGLSREIASQLVIQTMLGTAKLLRDEHMHPVTLREAVTSPAGTTTRALRELEQAGVRAAFLNAIRAAHERSRELAGGRAE